jgi:hypothetical protein
VQLPQDAALAFGDAELEADVTDDEILIRRRPERGHG